MSHDSIRFLDHDISLPLRFTIPLPFSEADKSDMPWLAEETRYYSIEIKDGKKVELGQGGRATAFKAFVSDRDGNRIPDTPDMVLKVPNLKGELYTSDQIREYLSRLSEGCGREWELTRGRLHGCEYANPIFDFSEVTKVLYLGELMAVPVTAQLFLQNAVSLDDYLLKEGQRQQPYKSKRGIPVDNWNGMSNQARWVELACKVATGLADIHQRRVVHGDIWPPNIFIKTQGDQNPSCIFIDFGESFPIEPKGDLREQRDHAYRAPERNDAQSIVMQQADVYSFGKLLLHLAIGEEPILSSKYRGHERRDIVRKKFAERNPEIANDNPFVIDIICKCVSLDPIDRLSMSEVLAALNSYVDVDVASIPIPSVSDGLRNLEETWNQVNAELLRRNTNISPVLEELVEQRLTETQGMIEGLSNGVITLSDTRERLIRALISLFQRLGEGDRFLSITSPHLWQGSALGLDGRYFTANALAAARKASIQRGFIFSIQEVGETWATELYQNLIGLNEKNKHPSAVRLAKSLDVEIKRYKAARQQGEARDLPEDLQSDARQRLALVIKSYLDASRGVCRNVFEQSDEFHNSIDCKGIYIGLIPVGTLGAMRTLKAAHPVSVLFYSHAAQQDQYLLMMTNCLGRNSLGGSEDGTYDDFAYQRSKPELKGITVFKSVLGVPEDRIRKIEQLLRLSIGIGHWLDKVYDALPRW